MQQSTTTHDSAFTFVHKWKHKWMRSSTLPQLSFKKSRGSWPSLILSFGFSFIPQISSYHRVFIIFALRSSYFLKAQFYRFGPSREYCNAGKSICLWILKLRRTKKPQIQLYCRSRGKILNWINGINQNLTILPSNCNINCHGVREIFYHNNLLPLIISFLVKKTHLYYVTLRRTRQILSLHITINLNQAVILHNLTILFAQLQLISSNIFVLAIVLFVYWQDDKHWEH